jgi:hypothetical protein
VKDNALETGASLTQDSAPLKSMCAHEDADDGVSKDGGLGVEGVGKGRWGEEEEGGGE